MENRLIDKILNLEIGLHCMKWKIVDFLFVLCLFVFAFLIRWKLMPIESGDYVGFLKEWMQAIRENGGVKSLSMEISNYTSPYMYIMTLLSYISANDLYALKLVSVFFDYAAAAAVFLILHYLTGNRKKAILGMAFLLLSPTVILDGAYWCQCDIIYTSFLLYSFYFFLKGDSKKSAVFFAISFTFKLQSVFLLPFFLIMWLKKKTVLLRHFLLYVPVIYIISIYPALLMGGNLVNLLTVYLKQSGTYPWGTLNYPNIYVLLGEAMPAFYRADEVSGAGALMTIMLLGCLAYIFYVKKMRITGEMSVTLALFSTAMIVYSLPHMHERYGFLADLFAIIYGIQRTEKLPVAFGFSLISMMSFMPFLIGINIVAPPYLAIALLGLIVYVGYDLYGQMRGEA